MQEAVHLRLSKRESRHCAISADRFVVVTNEVCSETAQDSPEMYRYKELLGKINCWMAKRAVQVTEVVYGIPLSVKVKKSLFGE